jgi:hypothetical protein
LLAVEGHEKSPLRSRRRILEATVAASLLGGTPSIALAFARGGVGGAWRYGVNTTRAVGVLVPPWRPNLLGGTLGHFAISAAAGHLFGRFLPVRRKLLWAAVGGGAMGLVNVGIIGRRLPALRDLSFGQQLADNIAFGVVFAAIVDRPK